MTADTRRRTPRSVLFEGTGGPRVRALAEVLRGRGHTVRHATGSSARLRAQEATVDVVVVDVADESETRALERLESIGTSQLATPFIVVTGHTESRFCATALRLGARELVLSTFDPRGLVEAVERIDSPDDPASQEVRVHRARYDLVRADSGEPLRALCAFLSEAGVALSHVVRVACAAAELVDNVRRHAYADRSESCWLSIEAHLCRTFVRLVVRDRGRGAVRPSGPPRDSGLARARTLSEVFDLQSEPGGTAVELGFDLGPVCAAGDPLPDVELLTPRALQPVVQRARDRSGVLDDVPSPLRPTVRRLVGGAPSLLRQA